MAEFKDEFIEPISVHNYKRLSSVGAWMTWAGHSRVTLSSCLQSMWPWAEVCVPNMSIITVSSLTYATSAMSLPHGIHLHLSHMDALHSDHCLTFLKNSAPFSAFGTLALNPTCMVVNEVFEVFKSIVSGQANNKVDNSHIWRMSHEWMCQHQNRKFFSNLAVNPICSSKQPYTNFWT